MSKPPTGIKLGNDDKPPGGVASSAVQALQIFFGENLRLARVNAGLTQRDIEARTGIKQAYVSQIEGGKLNPTLATMVALADVVSKDVRELLRPPPAPKRK